MCTSTRNVVCGKQNEVRQNGKAGVAIFLCYSTYRCLFMMLLIGLFPIYFVQFPPFFIYSYYENIPKYHLQVNDNVIVRFLSHSILQSVKSLSGKCSLG